MFEQPRQHGSPPHGTDGARDPDGDCPNEITGGCNLTEDLGDDLARLAFHHGPQPLVGAAWETAIERCPGATGLGCDVSGGGLGSTPAGDARCGRVQEGQGLCLMAAGGSTEPGQQRRDFQADLGLKGGREQSGRSLATCTYSRSRKRQREKRRRCKGVGVGVGYMLDRMVRRCLTCPHRVTH